MILWSWYALGVIITSFLRSQCKAALSPKHSLVQWLSTWHHNLCPESKLQISPLSSLSLPNKCHRRGGPIAMQMAFSPVTFRCHHVMLFTSWRLSGEPGKDGCATAPPGRCLLREAVHRRLAGFPQSLCANPDSSMIPPHTRPRPRPFCSRFWGFGTCMWLAFLPFCLPLTPCVSVQEGFHVGPWSPC